MHYCYWGGGIHVWACQSFPKKILKWAYLILHRVHKQLRLCRILLVSKRGRHHECYVATRTSAKFTMWTCMNKRLHYIYLHHTHSLGVMLNIEDIYWERPIYGRKISSKIHFSAKFNQRRNKCNILFPLLNQNCNCVCHICIPYTSYFWQTHKKMELTICHMSSVTPTPLPPCNVTHSSQMSKVGSSKQLIKM